MLELEEEEEEDELYNGATVVEELLLLFVYVDELDELDESGSSSMGGELVVELDDEEIGAGVVELLEETEL